MALTKVSPNIAETSMQSIGFKNKIIGGDFSTNPWQRGVAFAATGASAYTADRWRNGGLTGTGVFSIVKTLDAPTIAQAGVFTQHCFHVDVSTADVSLAASDYYVFSQPIEGYNVAPFGFGQAGVRYVTLSFWHKHTKVGIHCIAIRNGSNTRSYVSEYTQNVSDLWEKASITIPVDTAGTWEYDTDIGLFVSFTLAVGSESQTSANTWASGGYLATSNQVNNLDSISNNFKIALVQLEVGEKASIFESRSFQQELALCQRYYEKSYDMGTTPGTATSAGAIAIYTGATGIGGVRIPVQYKVTKRALASLTFYSSSTGASGVMRDESGADRAAVAVANGASGFTVGNNAATNAAGHNVQFVSNYEL
jgi:hypothetical protein